MWLTRFPARPEESTRPAPCLVVSGGAEVCGIDSGIRSCKHHVVVVPEAISSLFATSLRGGFAVETRPGRPESTRGFKGTTNGMCIHGRRLVYCWGSPVLFEERSQMARVCSRGLGYPDLNVSQINIGQRDVDKAARPN